jgi:hypothetical protein
MSAPNANESYAPAGYEKVSPGHYRRLRERFLNKDNPEVQAAQRAMAALDAVSDDPLEYYTPSLGEVRKLAPEANQPKPLNDLEAIAIDIRGLEYGDFMELAEGIGADPATLWKWATEATEGKT